MTRYCLLDSPVLVRNGVFHIFVFPHFSALKNNFYMRILPSHVFFTTLTENENAPVPPTANKLSTVEISLVHSTMSKIDQNYRVLLVHGPRSDQSCNNIYYQCPRVVFCSRNYSKSFFRLLHLVNLVFLVMFRPFFHFSHNFTTNSTF